MNPADADALARGAGLLAWAASSASVALGFWRVAARPHTPDPAQAARRRADVHGLAGVVAVAATVVHGAAVWAGRGGLPWSRVRGFGVALGVVAAVLLVAVLATSAVPRLRARAVWRAVHAASLGVFVTATLHALLTGTDTRHGLVAVPVALAASVATAAGVARLVEGGAFEATAGHRHRRRRGIEAGLVLARLAATDDEPEVATEAAPDAGTAGADPEGGPSEAVAAPGPATAAPSTTADEGAAASAPASTGADLDARIDLLRRVQAGLERLAPAIEGAPPPGERGDDDAPVAPFTRRLSVAGPPPTKAAPLPVRPARTSPAIPAPVDDAVRLLRAFGPGAGDGSGASNVRPLSGRGRARDAAHPAGAAPHPPDAVDPATGEPDREAYRLWLRDWLAYVESFPA